MSEDQSDPELSEAVRFLHMMYDLVKAFGMLADDLARIEEETGIRTSEIADLGNQDRLRRLFSELPPESLGLMMKLMFELSETFKKSQDLMSINSDEKRAVSREIKEVIEKYQNLAQLWS